MTEARRLAEYHSPEGAQEYLEEYQKLHRKFSDRRERRLLEGFFAQMGTLQSALDLPCGWGRYLPLLASRSERVVQSDYSGSMLAMGRERFAKLPVWGRIRASGTQLPIADGGVELAFSIRLNHHLVTPEHRLQHLREMSRISSRYLIFTYFDAASLKNRLRQRQVRRGRKKPKNTLARHQVRETLEQAGFRILADPMLFRIGSGHRVVFAQRGVK
ncbi:MAG: class I SAM-dependent methyltransferase [Planctomycetota bacterium]|nr:MAG: class I SAM-dependent methyltransferase [Planctomycetota bacterium]